MELIKKQIELKTITGTTDCEEGFDGNCFEILPDTGITYNIKIHLEAIDIDQGYFDAYNIDETEQEIQV